jgi:hypothetical protein
MLRGRAGTRARSRLLGVREAAAQQTAESTPARDAGAVRRLDLHAAQLEEIHQLSGAVERIGDRASAA